MNPIEQIEAEKLSKDTVKRAEALAILAEPSKISRLAWISPLALGFIGLTQSGGLNWLIDGELVKFNNLNYVFVSILAWSGFSFATLAYQEAKQNRKRLDAALTLLNLKEDA